MPRRPSFPRRRMRTRFADRRADRPRIAQATKRARPGLREITKGSVIHPKKQGRGPKGGKGDEDQEALDMLEFEVDGETLPQVVQYLQSWVSRGAEQNRSVTILTADNVELGVIDPSKPFSEADLEALAAKLAAE